MRGSRRSDGPASCAGRRATLWLGGAVALGATGCGLDRGALDPHGPYAASHRTLFLISLAIASVVVLVTLTLLGIALWRRRDGEDEIDHDRRIAGLTGTRFVAIGGFVVPTVLLMAVMGITFVFLGGQPQEGEVEVHVVGHQFWWEVRYPSYDASTANELYIPVGRDVELVLTSKDVIHSFWVPELQGKADLVPGRTNRLVIHADEAGVYRGRCAEFCGLQHAKMAYRVVAMEPDEFEAKLRALAEPAATDDAEGQRLFQEHACAACHTIRGTDADGTLGPELTHFGSRLTIGAGILDNEPGTLRAWIVNPQVFKPGAEMPPIPTLSDDELDTLVAYLQGLR